MIGLIYCIECLKTGKKYYGSTVKSLDERIKGHCTDILNYEKGFTVGLCESHEIIREGNYIASVVKEVEFDDKNQLLWEERWVIEADPQAINVKKPILSKTEKTELHAMCKKRYENELKHIFCECGSSFLSRGKNRHIQTKLHQNWLKKQV